MTHKLINTGAYLLIVDDSEIKEDDYCLMFDDYGNPFLRNTPQKYLGESVGHYLNKGLKKVISHLPLNNSPILEGVDLLPPLEDEVEKLAKEEILYNDQKRAWWKQGYNKAKEKYKYTEEDLRKAIEMARTLVDGKHEFEVENILGSSDDTYGIKQKYTEEKIIQSLQQPKIPVGFKCKIAHERWGVEEGIFPKLKTTTNSQGHTEWVGEYKF